MAILQECPKCHVKRSLQRKVCQCGVNLEELKLKNYWVAIYGRDRKLTRKCSGKSLNQAICMEARMLLELERENPTLEMIHSKSELIKMRRLHAELAAKINKIKNNKAEIKIVLSVENHKSLCDIAEKESTSVNEKAAKIIENYLRQA